MLKEIIAFFTGIYLLLAGFIASPNPYYFTDYEAYQNLEKGSIAQTYIDKLQLTEKGAPIMAGASPTVESKAQFNASCQPVGQVIELGCYVGSIPDHIYIMRVSDPAVAAVMDVTAAHEYLHAVYNRLTVKKQQEINTIIEKQLPLIKDENLQKRLAGYAKSEPGQQNNELHSIFGTEYRNLIPELETYYKNYFRDRLIIVGWQEKNTKYIEGKEQSLKEQRTKIERDDAALNSLNARMKTLLATGAIASYNSLVPGQNALVRQVNAEIKAYNESASAYNDLIASINNNTYSSFDLVK